MSLSEGVGPAWMVLIMLSKANEPELAENEDDSTCVNHVEGVLHAVFSTFL